MHYKLVNHEGTGPVDVPRYKCHKIVSAFMIGKIDGCEIHSIDGKFHIETTPSFIMRHNMNDPCYFVIYEDGYCSVSPAKAFESGYFRLTENSVDPEPACIVREFYEVYCEAVGGKAFNGKPLPKWPEFFADANKAK